MAGQKYYLRLSLKWLCTLSYVLKKSLLSAVLFDGLIKLESLRIVGRFSHYIDCSLGDIAVSCSDMKTQRVISHRAKLDCGFSWRFYRVPTIMF